MKGTIKIEANSKSGFSIEMNMTNVSKLDELLIFGALANAFELSEKDRTIFGAIIAAGGVEKVFGQDIGVVKIDAGLINKLRRESE